MSRVTAARAAALATFFLALAPVLVPLPARAGGIAVSPVLLELAPGQKSIAVTVRNAGDETATVQADPQLWTRVGGNDVYAADRAILATPPLFQIAPGAEQIVRVGFPAGIPAHTGERAYRVWFREVTPQKPRTADRASSEIDWRLNIGVPLFIAPAVAVRKDARFTAAALTGGKVRVKIQNAGNVRLRLHRLRLLTARGGAVLGELRALVYVFPGETRALDIPLSKPVSAGQSAVCVAESEEAAVTTDLVLTRE